ncbi:hypothetical protein P3T43_007279, partial [Paraburkholderia sp. GAS41]
SDDGYPLAKAGVKWIADDHIIVMTMGSVLRVRVASVKPILLSRSDIAQRRPGVAPASSLPPTC